MKPEELRKLLASVSAGETDIDDAMNSLRDLPFADLGFANVDHHRALRNGFPEVVFGQGKTTEQIIAILGEISSKGQTAMATRVSPEVGASVLEAFNNARYDSLSRVAVLQSHPSVQLSKKSICIVCAGTSDLPVAEEAAITAEAYGNRVERIRDVGVAGLHRLLHHREKLEAAAVIIVIAGMEGALPSVIGGLVSKPIIAVPTSVGYGASFGGIAALLGMLNSCAAGVTVVNIDNGFGAAHAASLINKENN